MVSVIMPVYNSEQYLSKAIDSVLNQTYNDFELILVNDGSKDGSLSICEMYAEKDKRIKVISKENGGICSARNAGLDIAAGDYIAFIDNDDEYVDKYLEIAVNNLDRYGCDIFRCRRTRVQTFADGHQKSDISATPNWIDNEAYVISSKELFEKYFEIKMSGAMYTIWTGVFKKSLFDDIRFDTRFTYGAEDWLANLMLYDKAKSIVFVADSLYIYNKRVSHSTSAKYDSNRLDTIIWSAEYENQMLRRHLGNNADKVIRLCNALYFVHIIKVLEHDNCPLTKKEKLKYFKSLKKLSAFAFNGKTNLFATPRKANIYIWLYMHGMSRLVYFLTKRTMKKRGNTQ